MHKNATTILIDDNTKTLKQLRKNVKNNTNDDDDIISCRVVTGEELNTHTSLSTIWSMMIIQSSAAVVSQTTNKAVNTI